jgi:HlyD family secretion protein
LTEQGIQNENRSRNQQIADINKSINQMQKSLNVLRNNKNNFLILAPETGRLSSFNINLGKILQADKASEKLI